MKKTTPTARKKLPHLFLLIDVSEKKVPTGIKNMGVNKYVIVQDRIDG
jgi:hypothetical protein